MKPADIVTDLMKRFPRAHDDILSWAKSYERVLCRIDPERLEEAYLAVVDSWTGAGFPKPQVIAEKFRESLPRAPKAEDAKEHAWDIATRQIHQRHGRLLDEFCRVHAERLAGLPSDQHQWHVMQIAKEKGFLLAQKMDGYVAITLVETDWTNAQERADSQATTYDRGKNKWPYRSAPDASRVKAILVPRDKDDEAA